MRNFIKTCAAASFGAFIICAADFSYADNLTDALRLKMKYLSQNQAVISKNLANANTPGYKAMELQEPRYGNKQSVGLMTTSPAHIGGGNGQGKFRAIRQKDTYETAPNGNNVSIEEQMVKMSANSTEHQATTNIMHKIGGFVGLATGER